MNLKVPDFDIIVVGSGPAGVSASFPLVKSGLKVMMVDSGIEHTLSPPSGSFMEERSGNSQQWEWFIGKDFYALRNNEEMSPKLRVPVHDYVFNGYIENMKISTSDFIAVGSLAKGGLSNAWGCGVAALSDKELSEYPITYHDIEDSYRYITKKIGVSGKSLDDLCDYFGVDAWAQTPIEMDELHDSLYSRYLSKRERLISHGFRVGRSRVAALSQNHNGRSMCNLSSNCLWGCHRQALYSAVYDLAELNEYDNFEYLSGLFVERLRRESGEIYIEGTCKGNHERLSAKKVLLAAGTLGSTRIAMETLNITNPVGLQSCPTAAFMLWVPSMLGSARKGGFGLGQISFAYDLDESITAFGSTFSTLGIPVSEFARYLPFPTRYGMEFCSKLLSSCIVGNVFLPGNMSRNNITIASDGSMNIQGGYSEQVSDLMSKVMRHLRKNFQTIGAVMLPGSFTVGKPGSDIHYACTFPMRASPVIGETGYNGELAGCDGVHIVDGACLSLLSEKSHTLTIMANANRIARNIASEFHP